LGKLRDEQLFPREWLNRYTVEELERLSIMTIDGGLTDEEAEKELERMKNGRTK
jgi:lipase chaperone LimK